MARSIDRNPSCGFAAGDPERVRRCPAHQYSDDQDKRSRGAARSECALRADPRRQFRLRPERAKFAACRGRSAGPDPAGAARGASVGVLILAQLPDLPQQLTSTQVIVRFGLRMTILVFFAMLGSIGFARSLAADVHDPGRRHSDDQARASIRQNSQSLGRNGSLRSPVLPGQRIQPGRSILKRRRSYAAPMRSLPSRPRIHIWPGRYWEHE